MRVTLHQQISVNRRWVTAASGASAWQNADSSVRGRPICCCNQSINQSTTKISYIQRHMTPANHAYTVL